MSKNYGFSAVETIYFSMNWVHKIASETCPTESSIPKLMYESAKRRCKVKPIKRDPIDSGTMSKILDQYGFSDDLIEVRFAAMSGLMYAGMMRFDDIIRTRRCNLTFYHDYLQIQIVSSKTDIYSEGQSVYIARSHDNRCPVEVLGQYLKRTNQFTDSQSKKFVFRRVIGSGPSARLSVLNVPISYSRARTIFKAQLEKLGCDSTHIGLHSFRIGAATDASNRGVSSADIKDFGRWKTDTAKNLYVRSSLKKKLEVSNKLKI